MNKTATIILFALLLLSCEEKCDSSCEMRKEFELSPTRVDWSYIKRKRPEPIRMHSPPAAGGRPRPRERYPKPFHINASMTRTETGILVKSNDEASIEFNMEEWLDFIRALYKGIDKEKHDVITLLPSELSEIDDTLEIKIYSSNKAEPNEYYKFYREEWSRKIRDIIKDMEEKIKRKIEFKKKARANQKGTFTDTRDGKIYKTVKIDTQTWMAENLNYAAEGSRCYGNKPDNCKKYGRLYNWKTAMKVCPSGWHLPSKDEWDILIYESLICLGECLKVASGWNNYKEKYDYSENDDYGFSALPGGYGKSDGNFYYAGDKGYWWNVSKSSSYFPYTEFDNISYGTDAYYYEDYGLLYSVRCLQD